MTVVRPNVQFTIARPQYSNGYTSAPQSTGVVAEAYLAATTQQQFLRLPATVTDNIDLATLYTLTIDSDTDLGTGDTLVDLVLAEDGTTPYPGDESVTSAWIVRYVPGYEPGVLDWKYAYVERRQTAGALHR